MLLLSSEYILRSTGRWCTPSSPSVSVRRVWSSASLSLLPLLLPPRPLRVRPRPRVIKTLRCHQVVHSCRCGSLFSAYYFFIIYSIFVTNNYRHSLIKQIFELWTCTNMSKKHGSGLPLTDAQTINSARLCGVTVIWINVWLLWCKGFVWLGVTWIAEWLSVVWGVVWLVWCVAWCGWVLCVVWCGWVLCRMKGEMWDVM